MCMHEGSILNAVVDSSTLRVPWVYRVIGLQMARARDQRKFTDALDFEFMS